MGRDRSFSNGNGPYVASGEGRQAENDADWQAGCFRSRPGHWWIFA